MDPRPTGHLPGGDGGDEFFPGGGLGWGRRMGVKVKRRGCVRVRAAEAKALGSHTCLIRHSPAYPVYNWPVPNTVTPAQQEGTEHLVLSLA